MDKPSSNSPIPVVFASDSGYALPLMTSVYSLFKAQTGSVAVQLYIIAADGFPESCKGLLNAMASRFGMPSPIFLQPTSNYDGMEIRISHTALATYYRLELSSLLPEVEKCIYLDCDTLVVGDLSNLYALGMEAYLIAGVKAASYYWPESAQAAKAQRLGIERFDQYVNAGVLLVNLALMRELGIEERFNQLLEEGFQSQDQDILNSACFGRIKILDPSYNLMTKYHPDKESTFADLPCLPLVWSEQEWENACRNPRIIHYADQVKPWNSMQSDCAERWWAIFLEMEQEGLAPSLSICLPSLASSMDAVREQREHFQGELMKQRRESDEVRREAFQRIEALQEEKYDLSQELQKVYGSTTWKAGRVLTFPLRMFKDFLSQDSANGQSC